MLVSKLAERILASFQQKDSILYREYHTFSLNLHQFSAVELAQNDFLLQGVIEIIFIDEILAKFHYAVKMVAVAPHHWFVQPLLAFYISFGVGYCFIQQQRQCEKPHQ